MDCCANVYCFDVFLLSIKDSAKENYGDHSDFLQNTKQW